MFENRSFVRSSGGRRGGGVGRRVPGAELPRRADSRLVALSECARQDSNLRPLPPQGTPAVGPRWREMVKLGSTSRATALESLRAARLPGGFLSRSDMFWTLCCGIWLQPLREDFSTIGSLRFARPARGQRFIVPTTCPSSGGTGADSTDQNPPPDSE